jgi:cytochrome c peroxidase
MRGLQGRGRTPFASIRGVPLLLLVPVTLLLLVSDATGQPGQPFFPNGRAFPNPGGTSQTYSTTGAIDLTGPFFQSLGTNGRTCGSCHQPSDGMTVSAAHVQQRFDTTDGLDPIFRPVDGANCPDLDVSTEEARRAAYSLLRTRGLIRIAIAVPATADFVVTDVDNPYSAACSDPTLISMYRRPLPSTNLLFLSAVMADGRESSPQTDTTKILYANYPTALINDLKHQALDATIGHAQGDGSRPTPDEQTQIVEFETALFTAQATGERTGNLRARGAMGGPEALVTQPFFISINSSVYFALTALGLPVPPAEQPGGLGTPGDGQFTPAIFTLFDAWANLPYDGPRAAVARGQALFNHTPINITGVAGINDDVSAGGLVPGALPTFTGTCGTCHDTPNVGNHSSPTPLNIGTGDPNPSTPGVNLGGLDIGYLPTITACQKDPGTGRPTRVCRTTTDLGQALIDGQFAHIGKIKGPILRGLSARAPYFHNGSAQTLLDVVRFYEVRFGISFTSQEEADLVAFLDSL